LAGESAAAVPPRHGRAWRWGWRALPIAALLLLSFGLGRLSLLYQGRPAAPVATTTPPATTSPGQLPAVADVSPPAVTAPIAGASAPGGAALATAVPAAGEGSNAGVRSRNGVAGNGAIYRFAAAQTLGQAELLLTSFRADTRARGSVDPQVAEWAGDVLSSTRLLLDSPAGRDPKLRALLEDVELVLAQIVQLRAAPAAAAPGDADLIDHALQQRDLLPRLRSAVPAGAPVGT